MRRETRSILVMVVATTLATIGGCAADRPAIAPGSESPRQGDEIMVAGRMFHTGAPVVLWFDPGGYDAYRVERRFTPIEESGWEESSDGLGSPNRFGMRKNIDQATAERVRGGGWTLEDLRESVDQFVIHYDACGTSRTCFRVLHDRRGLSVHFMIDIDGTIYQTLDAKERAWHATIANDRSVGVEIANIGAYPANDAGVLGSWYARDERGTRITLPAYLGDGGVRTPGFVGRPSRDAPVRDEVNGRELVMYDMTDEQYESLIHLAAALCVALPGIEADCPRDGDGTPLARTLTPEEFERFSGILGHLHVQENKVDPGPAFDWERVVGGVMELLRRRPARSR